MAVHDTASHPAQPTTPRHTATPNKLTAAFGGRFAAWWESWSVESMASAAFRIASSPTTSASATYALATSPITSGAHCWRQLDRTICHAIVSNS
eukprot:3769802-Rhodomonas_salina.4